MYLLPIIKWNVILNVVSFLTRVIAPDSLCAHEINSHEINSHGMNSSRDQLLFFSNYHGLKLDRLLATLPSQEKLLNQLFKTIKYVLPFP